MSEINVIAGILYEGYNTSVGGRAFNGDPLPTWSELNNDPNKVKFTKAWKDVAVSVKSLLKVL